MPQFLQKRVLLIKYNSISSWSILFLALWLVGCSTHQEIIIDKNKAQFDTRESNKLFFRNMRQPYYEKEELKDAQMEIFRINERDTSTSSPIIHVKIVQHWATDKAFAMVEPNAYLANTSLLQIAWTDSSQQQGTYQFQLPARQEDHFRFATELYTSLQKGDQLHFISDSTKIPIFNIPQHREAFRKTMVDFYRLVSIL